MSTNKYPIFAISGLEGQGMMEQLGKYSGLIDDIPYGDEINELYGPNPKDYVRIWTELSLQDEPEIPPLWAFFLVVIGALLVIILSVSLTMHLVQRRHRRSLRLRVESGEVDLEAMGVKRLTVPTTHIREFPLYTYNADLEALNAASTPSSNRASRSGRRSDQRSVRSLASVRSKRTSAGVSTDATATNFQPSCHICLARYDHRVTIIRELPCGHIFHPQCIDEFLEQNSSLCPMCKHCMLPRGYCPRITDSMVRRERALRRLRERVDLEDLSEGSNDTKLKGWGKRMFRSSSSPSLPISAPLAKLKAPKLRRGTTQDLATETLEQTTIDENAPSTTGSHSENQEDSTRVPSAARTRKPRRTRPQALNLLPTQPENSALATIPTAGRGSPSSFARERMREIAAKNAPFDDPDAQRAICKYRNLTFGLSCLTNVIVQGGVRFRRFSPDTSSVPIDCWKSGACHYWDNFVRSTSSAFLGCPGKGCVENFRSFTTEWFLLTTISRLVWMHWLVTSRSEALAGASVLELIGQIYRYGLSGSGVGSNFWTL